MVLSCAETWVSGTSAVENRLEDDSRRGTNIRGKHDIANAGAFELKMTDAKICQRNVVMGVICT